MNEFDYDAYEAVLIRLRDECITSGTDPQDLIRRNTLQAEAATLNAIDLQDNVMTDADRNNVGVEAAQHCFAGVAPAMCIAAWLLALEVTKLIKVQVLQTRFAPYHAEQALFGSDSGLLAQTHLNELVPRAAVKRIYSDRTAELQKGYARLDPLLDPLIIAALESKYPDLDLHVRLDPGQLLLNRPKSLLEEDMLVPAKHKWWSNLGLFRGESTGGGNPPTKRARSEVEFST